ncbi:MAG: GspH/FimT family pseudopilin [Hyphomicrobiales bacterium]
MDLLLHSVSSSSNRCRRFEAYLSTCPDNSAPSGFSSGFSIFEVLIVVAILSLAGAIAIPRLVSWRSNIRLINAAQELRTNLEAAKTLAAKENTTITLQFEPASGQYRMTFRNLDDALVAIKVEQLPPEVRIDSAHPEYTLTGNKVSFNSRGGADNGTIVLSNSNGKSKKISISIIGKIEVKNG